MVTKRKVLKKLKDFNTLWHPDSSLVFKSVNDKRVIGRYVDGEIIQLDKEFLDLCTTWGMKYDEDLYETIFTKEDDGEEEEEEEEAVEEETNEEVGDADDEVSEDSEEDSSTAEADAENAEESASSNEITGKPGDFLQQLENLKVMFVNMQKENTGLRLEIKKQTEKIAKCKSVLQMTF